eukprot:5317426-Pyramimonas_sp.AAC.1
MSVTRLATRLWPPPCAARPAMTSSTSEASSSPLPALIETRKLKIPFSTTSKAAGTLDARLSAFLAEREIPQGSNPSVSSKLVLRSESTFFAVRSASYTSRSFGHPCWSMY